MGDEMPNEQARKIRLNMMALQIAGDLPGKREDAQYVLRRIQKILDVCVFDESGERCEDVLGPRLSVVRGDRVS